MERLPERLVRHLQDRIDQTQISILRRNAVPDHLSGERLLRDTQAMIDRLAFEFGEGPQVFILTLPPGEMFVTALLAGLQAGHTIVPTPTPRLGSQSSRLRHIAQDCAATAILCVDATREAIERALMQPDMPKLQCPIVALDRPAITSLRSGARRSADPRPAIIQYTSGSMREPKGVRIFGEQILANHALVESSWHMDASKSCVNWLPHYHDMGLMGGILYPLLSGAQTVQMNPLDIVRRPVNWLRAISDHRATFSGGPAFAFADCLRRITAEECEGLDLSSWTRAYCGAEPIPAGLLPAFSQRFAPYGLPPRAVFGCYGLAETTLFAAGAPDEALLPEPPPGCGAVHPCKLTELTRPHLAIVDPDSRRPVPDGTAGEIWVSGPSNGAGYINLAEESAALFGASLAGDVDTAWLKTGDVGVISRDRLYVTGRLKDILIVNGRKIAAAEVEWLAGSVDEALNPLAAAAFVGSAEPNAAAVLMIELKQGQELSGSVDGIRESIRRLALGEWGLRLNDVQILPRGSLDRTTSGKIRRQAIASAYRLSALPAPPVAPAGQKRMPHDSWSDPALFHRDPGHIQQMLRSSAFIPGMIDDHLRKIEDATSMDLSPLRKMARHSLVYQAGTDHRDSRRIIAEFFSDRAMAGWDGEIAECVQMSLKQLRHAAQPDLMKDFVTPLFLSVAARIIGFEDDASGRLASMIATAQRMSEPMLSLRNLRELSSAMLYLLDLLPALENAPRNEPECLLAYLHRRRAEAPADVDLKVMALALLLAANTAAQTMGFALYGMLMGDAADWSAAAAPGWSKSQLDRLLSLYPATLTMARVASADLDIAGCPYAAGEAVVIDVVSANARMRAEATAQVARARAGLSFGAGAHKCPGEFFARRLLSAAIPALAREFPELILHREAAQFRVNAMVQAPVSLPCQLERRSMRLTSRLVEIRDIETARGIVNDDAAFAPPQMEPHLRLLETASGRDMSTAIRISRNALFFMSGERHAIARRAIAEFLGGNRLGVWEGLIDEHIGDTLDALDPVGTVDLVGGYADPLFRKITQSIFGIKATDIDRFNMLAPKLQDVLEPWLPLRDLVRMQDMFGELFDLMIVPEKAKQDSVPSLLAALLTAELRDFDADDIKALILVLYGASFNLSHTLGNVLHWILIQPPEERRDVADPQWIAGNLERLIALCASPKYIYRMARAAEQRGGLDLGIRDTARLQLASIDRDVSHGHLAFGHGLHRCVGAALTRLVLRRAVPEIFKRFPNIKLVPQGHKYFDMSQTVAMSSLPLSTPG